MMSWRGGGEEEAQEGEPKAEQSETVEEVEPELRLVEAEECEPESRLLLRRLSLSRGWWQLMKPRR